MKDNRNQSIELLRIILMTLIVFGHILLFGIGINNSDGTPSITNYIQPLYMFHVDAFVFISGFYGIKLKWEKFALLIFKMVIYSIVACGCYFLLTSQFSLTTLIHNIYPFSTCDWWFMAQYLFLMLMVPFLNAGMDKLDKKHSAIILCIMYIATFRTFYCLLVFVYLFGRYLRKYPILYFEKNAGKIFISTLVLFFVFNLICMKYCVHPNRLFEYISPFNIIAASAIFFVFYKIKLNIKYINYLSTGVLAAYLITSHELMQTPFNSFIVSIFGKNIILLIIVSFVIVLVCSIIDRIVSYFIKHNMDKKNFVTLI